MPDQAHSQKQHERGPKALPAPKSDKLATGCALVFLLVVFLGLFAFFGDIYRNAWFAWRLRQDGVEIEARCWSGGIAFVKVKEEGRYKFEIDGKMYLGRAGTDLKYGETIRVLYLPDDPDVNRPADSFADDIRGAILMTVIFLVMGAGSLIGWVADAPKRHRRAARTAARQCRDGV